MKNSYQQFISKPEISFWVPIIITIVSWAFYAGITVTKLNAIEQTLAEIKSDSHTNLQAMNRLESHVCTLDTMNGLKCIDGQ